MAGATATATVNGAMAHASVSAGAGMVVVVSGWDMALFDNFQLEVSKRKFSIPCLFPLTVFQWAGPELSYTIEQTSWARRLHSVLYTSRLYNESEEEQGAALSSGVFFSAVISRASWR